MKAIVFLFVVILMLPIHAADFSVVLTPATREACPSQHTSYELMVRNDKTHAASYNIFISDDIRNWTTLIPNTINVGARDTGTATVFVQPHYTAKPENIEFTITTASTDGTIPLKGSLAILNCRGVELISPPVSTCDEELSSSSITIKNTGISKDIYTLSSDKRWAILGNNTVEVEPNQSKQVTLDFVDPPIGSETVRINASSASKHSSTFLDIPFELGRCFDIEATGEEIEMCPGETKTFQVKIRNAGTYKDTVLVYTKEAVVDMENTTLEISPGENKTVSARVYIPGTATMNQTLDIHIEGAENTRYEQVVEVTPAEECYSIETSLENKDIQVQRSESNVTKLVVKNKGKLSVDLRIDSDRPWVDVSPKRVLLKQGEEKEIFIYAAPTLETEDGKHASTIILSGNHTSENETLNIFVNQNVTLSNSPGNGTGPILDTERIKKPFEDTLKFIFSPILKLLDKL